MSAVDDAKSAPRHEIAAARQADVPARARQHPPRPRPRRRLRGGALLLLLVLAPLHGCFWQAKAIGIKLRKHTRFDSEWKTYRKLADFKSLAVAGDIDGIYVSGLAYDHRRVESAIEAALRYCEERRIDRGIADSCRIYSVGDEPVDPSSPDIEP